MIAIKEAILFFIRKTFDIRKGELFLATLMQLNIFLIITTLLIVKPTVNGLFLSKFGVESLPYAFILVAVIAAIVTSLYTEIVRRIPLNKIISGTIFLSVFSLLFFGLFLRLNIMEGFILFLFYIWVAIFALLATSQFWVLANIIFNAREAKRLFGFIGAGAIAGGIFGGYLTSVLAQFISSENLPFVAAFFIGLCIPVNRAIWNLNKADKQLAFQPTKRLKGFGNHPLILVLKSRHLTFLASIVGVSVMVAKLVDYQFGGIAAALIPDPDELTAFFGFWLSTFSVISLLLQLFVTRRVVGIFGVSSSLLFLPVTVFLAVIALILFPSALAAAVFLKMADGGLKQSINKAAIELLVMPIPTEVKKQTKTFIDVFIDSLATGISGVILIFLVQGLNLSTTAINGLIIGLLLLWFYLISQVKKEYLRSFRQKINDAKDRYVKKEPNMSQNFVLHGLKKALKNGLQQQLVLLQKVNELEHDRKKTGSQETVNFLFGLSDNSDLSIRLQALRGLNLLKNNFPKLKFSRRKIVPRILAEAKLYEETLGVLLVQTHINTLGKETFTRETTEFRKELIDLLEKKLDENMERVFRLLGLIHPDGDIYLIYKSIHSQKYDVPTSALELLDNLLEPSLKRRLIPLVEISMLETISEEAIENLSFKIPEEYESFQLLLNGNDTTIKIAVLYLLEQMNQKQYYSLIKVQMDSEDEQVRDFARRVEKAILPN